MYEGTVLNLEFEDTTWMDNINKVIVNDKECKKSTINSFSSDTNIWEVGSATGAYGSYKALKLAVPDGKLWTVKVSADGYKDLTVKITKETVNYTDTTAESGTTYTYTVRAYNKDTMSDWNSTKSLMRISDTTLTGASNITYGVQVKWSRVTGATGYIVYRKGAGKGWARIADIKSGSTVSYTDTTAASGTT